MLAGMPSYAGTDRSAAAAPSGALSKRVPEHIHQICREVKPHDGSIVTPIVSRTRAIV